MRSILFGHAFALQRMPMQTCLLLTCCSCWLLRAKPNAALLYEPVTALAMVLLPRSTTPRRRQVHGLQRRATSTCGHALAPLHVHVQCAALLFLQPWCCSCDSRRSCSVQVQRPNLSDAGAEHDSGMVSDSDIMPVLERSGGGSGAGAELGHPAEVAMKWVKKPLGSVRISLGYMSRFEDVDMFSRFLARHFTDLHVADLPDMWSQA